MHFFLIKVGARAYPAPVAADLGFLTPLLPGLRRFLDARRGQAGQAMRMNREDYTEANRLAWNEAAPVHAGHNQARLLESFRAPDYSCLDALETEGLLAVGLSGKAVAHVCCNNGQELLSIKNLGAARCVGFDISEEFIAQARELNAAASLDCKFVVCDAYAIGPEHDGTFDLVYISVGALGWMPDLPGFLAVVARLLRPGGHLFVYEMHPFLDMLDPAGEMDPANPLELRHSYFKGEPYVDAQGLDYYSHTSYDSRPMYWFHHKMSDVIGGCLRHGLVLERFEEYPHDISDNFAHLTALPVRVPASYILVGRKGR